MVALGIVELVEIVDEATIEDDDGEDETWTVDLDGLMATIDDEEETEPPLVFTSWTVLLELLVVVVVVITSLSSMVQPIESLPEGIEEFSVLVVEVVVLQLITAQQ